MKDIVTTFSIVAAMLLVFVATSWVMNGRPLVVTQRAGSTPSSAEPFQVISGVASSGQSVVLRVDKRSGETWILVFVNSTNVPYIFMPVPTAPWDIEFARKK